MSIKSPSSDDRLDRSPQKKKGSLSTKQLPVIFAVIAVIIGLLLVLTGVYIMIYGFPVDDSPSTKVVLPGIVLLPENNVQKNNTDSINQTSDITEARISDLVNTSNSYEPVMLNSTDGMVTLLYQNNISYKSFCTYETTSLKAVAIQPVTEIVIDYFVPNINVTKYLVDKEVIENGVLISRTYKTVIVTRPDPDAILEIKIFDEAGNLVRSEGYAGQYDNGNKDVIEFLGWGNYTVEMTGKWIDFQISIIEK